MDTLHKAALDALVGAPYQVLAQIVARKMADAGIHLTASQIEELVASLRENHGASFSVSGIDIAPTISLDAADNRRMSEEIENLLATGPRTALNELTKAVPDLLARLDAGWPVERKRQKAERRKFVTRLDARWGEALSNLDEFLTMAREVGASINDEARQAMTEVNCHSIDVLTRLHARCCQVLAEVATLLEYGFADGAMARWRTMHEIAATALFIQAHGEPTAERFAAYQAVERQRALEEYSLHHARLRHDPIDEAERCEVQSAYESVRTRYGKDFSKKYGWASHALGLADVNFLMIERAANIDHLRPYYKLATQNVHANPAGTYQRLGAGHSASSLLAGVSDLGLAEAGQNAPISLLQTTSAILLLSPTFDNIVGLKLLDALLHRLQEAFVAAHKSGASS